MAPFPSLADHWHVTTPRRGYRESARLTRDEALELLRQHLEEDGRITQDPRYRAALAGLDAGWTTARIDHRLHYVAFACACPSFEPSDWKETDGSHVPQVLAV